MTTRDIDDASGELPKDEVAQYVQEATKLLHVGRGMCGGSFFSNAKGGGGVWIGLARRQTEISELFLEPRFEVCPMGLV